MLGIRLDDDADRRLARFARDAGRPKSTIAREWIIERLDRESIERRMRRTAEVLAGADRADDYTESDMDD